MPPASSSSRSVRRRLRGLRRAVLARRRPLAALMVALAVFFGLRSTIGPGPPTVQVPVASHDLAAGERLSAADVEMATWPASLAPAGLTTSAAGQVLAAPLRRGEAITDLRVVGAELALAHPKLTVMPLRLPDPAVVGLLRAGDRIDLSAVDPESGETAVVAQAVLILAIPPPGEADSTLTGRVVIAGLAPEEAADVIAATLTKFLSVSYTR